MEMLLTWDHILQSKAFFKESKNQPPPLLLSPQVPFPAQPLPFVPCLGSAPVACVVRIAGILITQLQPSARIPGDPGKHTLLQGHGQVTESRLPKALDDVFLLPPPAPSFACPKPGTNLGTA